MPKNAKFQGPELRISGLSCVSSYVDKKRPFVDLICLFADIFVILQYKIIDVSPFKISKLWFQIGNFHLVNLIGIM